MGDSHYSHLTGVLTKPGRANINTEAHRSRLAEKSITRSLLAKGWSRVFVTLKKSNNEHTNKPGMHTDTQRKDHLRIQ